MHTRLRTLAVEFFNGKFVMGRCLHMRPSKLMTYMTGERELDINTLRKLQNLGVNLIWLLNGKGPMIGCDTTGPGTVEKVVTRRNGRITIGVPYNARMPRMDAHDPDTLTITRKSDPRTLMSTTHDPSEGIWLTAKEAATLMGVSKRAVQKNCTKFGKYIVRSVRGNGGLHYEISLSSLPLDLQATYLSRLHVSSGDTDISVPPSRTEGVPATFVKTPATEEYDHVFLLDTDHLPI